ncbi:hypothetical protein R1flu_010120 [Riccia fluitans]|uniref:Uncharacterized protein n=1 Tax=Riccia fluitans TaxID=41844 RepID=A0ABD1Z473_9MARC
MDNINSMESSVELEDQSDNEFYQSKDKIGSVGDPKDIGKVEDAESTINVTWEEGSFIAADGGSKEIETDEVREDTVMEIPMADFEVLARNTIIDGT